MKRKYVVAYIPVEHTCGTAKDGVLAQTLKYKKYHILPLCHTYRAYKHLHRLPTAGDH